MPEPSMFQHQSDTTKKGPNLMLVVQIILILGLIGLSGYLFYQNQQSKKELLKLQDPQYLSQLQQDRTKKILEDMGKIILLPSENPIVYTLTNVDELKKENKEFYADAINGDVLAIYSKKAILYRIEENKIINVAPVFVQPEKSKDDNDTSDNTQNNSTENIELDNSEDNQTP